MPAAAVIPAPIAYFKVVAVKKLVVGFWANFAGPPNGVYWCGCAFRLGGSAVLNWVVLRIRPFTLRKSECSKQAFAHECYSIE